MTQSPEQAQLIRRVNLDEQPTGQINDWWMVISPERDTAVKVHLLQQYAGAASMVIKLARVYTGDTLDLDDNDQITGNLITHTTIAEGNELKSFEPKIFGKPISIEVSPPLPADETVRREIVGEFAMTALNWYETGTSLEAQIHIATRYPR